MSTELNLQQTKKEYHGTIKSYAIGFFASLLLTLTSFSLVAFKLLSGRLLVHTIISLALVQAIIQLRFFLHLGQEAKPRWETFVFSSLVLVLLIIVGGSLWIMSDLKDRVMSDM